MCKDSNDTVAREPYLSTLDFAAALEHRAGSGEAGEACAENDCLARRDDGRHHAH